MALKIPCPECGAVLRIPESQIPRRGKCPKCSHAITLVATMQEQPSESPSMSSGADPPSEPATTPAPRRRRLFTTVLFLFAAGGVAAAYWQEQERIASIWNQATERETPGSVVGPNPVSIGSGNDRLSTTAEPSIDHSV